MHLLMQSAAPSVGARFFDANGVISPYIYVFYAAYVVSFLLTPMLRTVAIYYGIIDQPDNLRKLHNKPVAYLGGVAVFMGWLAGLAVTQFLSVHRPEKDLPDHLVINFSLVAGACIIVILGLWDDVIRINPWMKIGGQVAAAVALLSAGIGTRSSYIFIAPVAERLRLVFPSISPLPPEHPLILLTSSIFVIVIVVACCNATNLLDGLDGLCGGVTAVIAAGFLVLATHLAMTSGALNANEDALRVVLALALLGAVLGFVPFNFNPASIFMGDTGSMFLGYACATMIILFSQGAFPKWFLASIVIFALPILDTTLAFVRRWVNGRPLFSADRYHFHHQLVARGFTVKQTVMISYGLAFAFAVLGTAIVFFRSRYAVAIYLVVFGSIVVAAYKMGMVHERTVAPRRKSLSATDAVSEPGIEPGNVIEIHDDRPGSLVTAARIHET